MCQIARRERSRPPKGRLRAKLSLLKEALDGRFDGLHTLLVGAILAHLDFLDEQVERLPR